MITFLVILLIISFLGVINNWEDGSATVLSMIFTIIIWVASYSMTTFEEPKVIPETTELHSIKNFSNTVGYSWYIGTDSDYVSYIKKDGGFIKFRMPESSIIKEDGDLTTIGYYTRNVCDRGTGVDPLFLFGTIPTRCRRFDLNPVITVPPNTVTLDFKI